MPALERRVSLRGPRFYYEGETLMFVLQLDGSTRVGPREATAEDANEYSEAYERAIAGIAENDISPVVKFADPPEGKPEPKPLKPRGQGAA